MTQFKESNLDVVVNMLNQDKKNINAWIELKSVARNDNPHYTINALYSEFGKFWRRPFKTK